MSGRAPAGAWKRNAGADGEYVPGARPRGRVEARWKSYRPIDMSGRAPAGAWMRVGSSLAAPGVVVKGGGFPVPAEAGCAGTLDVR